MHFNIKGINGKCEFNKINMQDGLRIAGYATKIHSGSVEESAEAMVKLGDIALKYLKINGELVSDVAGLALACDTEDNPMILTSIALKFMEKFEDFL